MAWSVTNRNIKRGGGSKKGLTSWVLVDILTLIKQAPEEERMTIRTSTVDGLLDAHSYSVKLVATIVTSDCLGETDYNIWCSKNFGRAGRCTCLQPKKKCQLHPQPLLSLSQRICISSPSNSANSLSWHQALLKCFRYSKLSLNRTWRDWENMSYLTGVPFNERWTGVQNSTMKPITLEAVVPFKGALRHKLCMSFSSLLLELWNAPISLRKWHGQKQSCYNLISMEKPL